MVKENQSIPGEPEKMRRVTGLNTDATGKVVYNAASVKRANEIRNNKIHTVRKALTKPEIFGDESGDLLVVSWGSSRGVLEESVRIARETGLKVSGLNLKVVYPLPLNLKEIFSNFKQVGIIELAYGDALKASPLSMMLRSETLVDIKQLVTEPTGRPIKPTTVIERIKEVL